MAFAAVGGLSLGFLGVPAGYLSGSILVVACAAIAGRPVLVPASMTRVLLVLLGISLGAVVSPETLKGIASYPLSIAVLLAAMICISFGGAAYLRLVHGWDLLTGYLAAAPGGLSQVMALAAELGTDLRAIAIVQTLRVAILAAGLPTALSVFGFVGHPNIAATANIFDPTQLDELAILVAVSTVAAIIAHWVNFPGGLLFGAMISSAALHGAAIVHVAMPWWLTNTVMIAFGGVTGARFAGTTLRMLLNFLGAALGSFTVAAAITAVFAAGLVGLLSLPVSDVMVAYAPGAVDAMMLLALALHVDPVYVGSHHLVRIFFVLLSMPVVARRAAKAPLPEDEPIKPPQRQHPFED